MCLERVGQNSHTLMPWEKKGDAMTCNYCVKCGTGTIEKIPKGEDRIRSVCPACGHVHYQNPIMVVGTIPEWEGQILLCRRNIEPCLGKWTLPAGYLECGETLQEGAWRETLEETRSRVSMGDPYIMCNIVFVNHIYMMFRATLQELDFGPTSESSEVRLFKEGEIPWDDIAFPVMEETLDMFFKDRKKGKFPFRIKDIEKGITP